MDDTEHKCFTASATSYLRNLSREDLRSECIAIHYQKPPVSSGGLTSISLVYPLLLVSEYAAKPNEVAERVAAILNAHWDDDEPAAPADHMTENSWRVAQIMANGTDGEWPIAAWVSGIWALDYRVFDTGADIAPGWSITHLPTGFLAGGIIGSLAEAQAVVSTIDAFGDWNFTDGFRAREFAAQMQNLAKAYPDAIILKQAMYSPGGTPCSSLNAITGVVQ